MNWDAIGAIGELVGSAAVVITIAYLAIQTKNNTKATQSRAVAQSRLAMTEAMKAISEDGESVAIYYAGLTNPSSLKKERRLHFDILLSIQVRSSESIFLDFREGLVPDELWESHWRSQLLALDTRGGREWWERHQGIVTVAFKEWINAELKRTH